MPNRKSKRISDRHKKDQLVDVNVKEHESNMVENERLENFVTEENEVSKTKILILQMKQCLARLKSCPKETLMLCQLLNRRHF